jgi:ribosomal protein S18 acetylase RimI-like enzyme
MADEELENPIWHSLRSRHAPLAIEREQVARFPPEYAPFLGVRDADAASPAAIASLLGEDETVYLLGVLPKLPTHWSIKAYAPLAQMVCRVVQPPIAGPAIVELGAAHRADVLDLTALVYPHYFRPRTMDLGRYFGIYVDGRLAAMIGERMGMARHQEISAVCTHPDFLGRGYARQLLVMLSNEALARGLTPFLHVSHENTRAKTLYEQMGFVLRSDIGFWSLRRS